MTGNRMGEDLMTRRQVASLFRVTSAAVASWARRGRLPEVRNEAGRPRYRRADVEALFQSGSGRGRDDRAVRPVRGLSALHGTEPLMTICRYMIT